MALSVTSDLVDVSSADALTSGGTWYRLAGTSSANPAADTDAFVQGNGCVANKMGATISADVGGHFNHTSTFDLTNKHLFYWRQIVTPGNMLTKANQGITIGLTNTTTTSTTAWSTTNYKKWFMDGSDTMPIAPGWVPYTLDPTSTADLSAGTLTLASVKNVGFICRQNSGVTTTVSNQFVDAVRAGTGLTATTSVGTDIVNFNNVFSVDNTVANRWGIVTQSAGIFYGAGRITVGATNQTSITQFQDAGQVFIWRDNIVSATLYTFQLLGAAGFKTTMQLTGCVLRGQANQKWNMSADANSEFKLYSDSIADILNATLSATSIVDGCTFSSCGTIQANGASITGSSFSSPTATQLVIDSPAEMAVVTNNTFQSGGTGHAIEITATGSYSFSGNDFVGYGASGTTNAAVYNNSGGAVVINVSGGGTPTVRNGTGASTTVNNTVAVTLSAQVSLAGAEIRIYDLDNSPAGSFGTELSGTESNLTSTYTYSGSAGNLILIQIMLGGYIEYSQQYTMPTANASLAVTLLIEEND